MNERDFNQEYLDNEERKYAYDFDTTVRELFLKRVAPQVLRSGNSLEIGAYLGDMTEQILKYVSELEVVEPSSELVAHLRERFQNLVVHQSAIETFEPQSKYQNIFLIHTLEHLEYPVEALRRITQLLDSKGKLFVMVPNANALSRQIAVQMGIISHSSAVTKGEKLHGHFRTYSLETLLLDIREAGLNPIDFGGVVVKPMANFQLDAAIAQGIISEEFIEGCDRLARVFPDFSSSIVAVCETGA